MALRTRPYLYLLLAVLIVPVGLMFKLYNGSGSFVISNKIAGSLYVFFWCLIFRFLFYKGSQKKLVLVVTVVSVLLEFTQLLKWELLENIRRSFIGVSLIGSTFSLSDITFYFIGSLAAWYFLRSIERQKLQL